MGMRQLGAPVKHETSHPSALLGTPSRGCAGPCRRHYRTGGGTKASARRPPRTGTAGSWVGARCCARSLGRRPPVAVPRVGAPSPPPGASTAAPPTANGTPVPRPQVDCTGDGWWEKIALRARASRSRYAARAARSAVCIVAIRVARERSKKLRRRPQGAGRCKHSAHERKRL